MRACVDRAVEPPWTQRTSPHLVGLVGRALELKDELTADDLGSADPRPTAEQVRSAAQGGQHAAPNGGHKGGDDN